MADNDEPENAYGPEPEWWKRPTYGKVEDEEEIEVEKLLQEANWNMPGQVPHVTLKQQVVLKKKDKLDFFLKIFLIVRSRDYLRSGSFVHKSK